MTWLQLIFEAPNAMRLRSQNKYLRKYEIFIQKRKQNIFLLFHAVIPFVIYVFSKN